jgi:hypothetical protein
MAADGRGEAGLSRSRPTAAPRLLDPALALVERIDRWRRRIRPARVGALLGIERGRFRGAATTLADGTRLVAGAPIWVLHFDNARLRELTAADSWPTRAYAVAADDLRAIAARIAPMPSGERPVALGGVTLVAPLSRRLGFAVVARPRTRRSRLDDWYLRSLLARWSPAGRERLDRGLHPRRAAGTWISTAELLRRYGPPPE